MLARFLLVDEVLNLALDFLFVVLDHVNAVHFLLQNALPTPVDYLVLGFQVRHGVVFLLAND